MSETDRSDDVKSDDVESDHTVRGRGDDEREHREQIEKTGEPNRDKLGNADGAS